MTFPCTFREVAVCSSGVRARVRRRCPFERLPGCLRSHSPSFASSTKRLYRGCRSRREELPPPACSSWCKIPRCRTLCYWLTACSAAALRATYLASRQVKKILERSVPSAPKRAFVWGSARLPSSHTGCRGAAAGPRGGLPSRSHRSPRGTWLREAVLAPKYTRQFT